MEMFYSTELTDVVWLLAGGENIPRNRASPHGGYRRNEFTPFAVDDFLQSVNYVSRPLCPMHF